ncbi:MAG TPA: flagellar motor switch protein FliN [Jatrophihabitans sp.]|nr:flagellar motor switch protein FliN [Jatrophihabitans sp.]
MTTSALTDLDGLLAVAAETAATTMASGETLTPGPQTHDPESFQAGSQAVLAPFAGPRSGELLYIVDDELSNALQAAPEGPVDLGDALAPVLQAIAAAIGPVALGPVQVTERRLAVNRILAASESGLVPLLGADGPRAAVALSLMPQAQAPQMPQVPQTPSLAPSNDLPVDRLDLLRGVEMEATAELGRTRMTVNDLLALRSGAVIELDRVAGDPADLLVNGRLIARGEVVVVDENYGIRITQVVSDAAGR